MKSETRNIVTIEDPVEYKVEGITQIQVNDDIGRTFASILRSVLRQDPDVIKVGEIRDGETAEIAMRASMTGHLVLSTLHTNSTAATITRLIDVGVAPYLLGSSLSAILAQRLVKRICSHCRVEMEVDGELAVFIDSLGLPEIRKHYKGEGCQYCYNTGYLGRTAIYEYLPVSLGIKSVLFKDASEMNIVGVAREEGVKLLFDDAWEKVNLGVTTAEEVIAKIPLEESRKASGVAQKDRRKGERRKGEKKTTAAAKSASRKLSDTDKNSPAPGSVELAEEDRLPGS